MSPEQAWFIQWSRLHKLWHCLHCGAVSKNQEFDRLIHLAPGQQGPHGSNALVHKIDCKYLKASHDATGKGTGC